MKKIKFQDTSFRDGFQSIFGARVFAKDFMPAVEAACKAGITHFEAGGGARLPARPASPTLKLVVAPVSRPFTRTAAKTPST